MRITNTIKSFFILGCVLISSLVFVAYKMYTKPHRAVADEKAIMIKATDLFQEFEQNEARANEKYLDKVLEVTGKILEVTVNMDKKQVLVLETNDLVFGIRCTMDDSIKVQPGTNVVIKGICTGYLSDVVITNGVLVK